MKRRIAIAAIFGTALLPTLALAAEGGGEATGSWGALVFYLINFSIFAGIVWKFAIPAVKKFFKDRASGIRETLVKADDAFHEAQNQANQAAERIAKLEAEKAQIASDLADETVYQIGRIYDLAEEAAARIKRDHALTVAAMRDNAQRGVRQALARAAARLAFELVALDFQSDDQARLLDGFVERLREEAR